MYYILLAFNNNSLFPPLAAIVAVQAIPSPFIALRALKSPRTISEALSTVL